MYRQADLTTTPLCNVADTYGKKNNRQLKGLFGSSLRVNPRM